VHDAMKERAAVPHTTHGQRTLLLRGLAESRFSEKRM